MSSALELADSRVSAVEVVDGVVTVQFSHAYIHKSRGRAGRDPGTGWSRPAALLMDDATCSGPLPPVPNTVSEGYVEVGGIRHELLPLPFKRKVPARLALTFVDGTRLDVSGNRPVVELLGAPIYLEEFR
ncbi:MAG TPA: hypothetical protein VKA76_04630 [Gammaproteobacteria bacterium]|nr:hypothetical protein [Gammaproteobacteria bacterium]